MYTLLYLSVDAREAELFLLQRFKDVVGNDSLHLIQLGRQLELLDQSGDDHRS